MMTKVSPKRIPVNIISGPLGVGKTTTINYLMTQRPPDERWAILVNEYGLVGLDAALMEKPTSSSSSGVEIKEVAGGCICCSAGFMFGVSLVLLLQRRPDRLLIEPTGLAALSGILDTLDRPGIREAVDVRSIVCLLDPTRFDATTIRDEVKDQIEASDVLLANRSDLATPKQRDDFHSWARTIFPPKRHIAELEQGRLPLSILDIVSERNTTVNRGGHVHGTDHQLVSDAHGHGHHHAHDADRSHEHGDDDRSHEHRHDDLSHEHGHEHSHDTAEPSGESSTELVCNADNPIVQRSHRSTVASSIGWVCWDELVFDAERITGWIRELSNLPGARRTKAVVKTNDGWWGFNIVDEEKDVRPSGYRRDTRFEVIIENESYPDTELLEQKLRSCLISAEAVV